MWPRAGQKARAALVPCSIVLAAMLAALPAGAQKAVDGDSLEVGGRKFRLHGVDAPELAQICADGWPAGVAAERYLEALIDGKQVLCVPILGENAGETIAICRADSVDLGAAMVAGGLAYANVPHSARYISQEDAAAKARRGIHGHDCVAPWEWRARLGEER